MRRGIRLGERKEAYDVSAVVTYLRYHAMKVVTLQTFVPQLAALILLLVINSVFLPAKTENELGFTVDRPATQEDTFQAVSSIDSWYDWAEAAYTSINQQQQPQSGAAFTRFPVGGVLFRHFALEPEDCPSTPMSRKLKKLHEAKGIRGSFPEKCRGSRQRGSRQLTSALNPMNTSEVVALSASGFQSTAWGGQEDSRLVPSMFSRFSGTINANLGTYTSYSSAVFVPFTNSSGSVRGGASAVDTFDPNWITELREGHWLRSQTIAVSAEAVIYHVTENVYIHHIALLEVFQGGKVEFTTRHTPFRMYTINTTNDKIFLGFSIGFGSLVVFVLIIEFLYRVALKRELHGSWLSSLEASDWLHVCMLGVSCALCGLHYYLFYVANEDKPPEGVSQLRSLTFLIHCAEASTWVSTVYAWTVFLYLVRVFMFLRYLTRMSLVNETLISSVHDFVGITFVATLVLVTYALTGHILWYQTDTDFATFGGSFMMLFNVMISLEVQNYDVYMLYNPRSTFVFFVTFFIVGWCVILNVAVGVLATSFASALETQTFLRRPNWSVGSLIKDAKSLVARMFYKPPKKGEPHTYPGFSSGDSAGGADEEKSGKMGNSGDDDDPNKDTGADDPVPDGGTDFALQRTETFVLGETFLENYIISQRSALYRCIYPVVPRTVRRVVDINHGLAKYLEVQEKEIDQLEKIRQFNAEKQKKEAEEKKTRRMRVRVNAAKWKDDDDKGDDDEDPSHQDRTSTTMTPSTQPIHSARSQGAGGGEPFKIEDSPQAVGGTTSTGNLDAKEAAVNALQQEEEEEEGGDFDENQWQKKFDINPKSKERSMKGVIMLDDFQLWSKLDLVGARRIGAKANLHIGLHDVKLREWKMLQKAVEGGNDVTTQMATQLKQLQDLHEVICGSGSPSTTNNKQQQQQNPSGFDHNGDPLLMEESLLVSGGGVAADGGPIAVLRATLLDVVAHSKEVLEKTPGSRIKELEDMLEVLQQYNLILEGGGRRSRSPNPLH